MATRKEHDFIGELEIDDSKYYGVQSFRALENFKMTGRTFGDYPFFVKAFAQIKKAAAMANAELGVLDKTKADYLCKAADRICADGAGGRGHLGEGGGAEGTESCASAQAGRYFEEKRISAG